jgi:hypothetical protein
LTLSIALSTSAQAGKPNLIDVHVHYNGEPDVLQKLLGKLEAVNGMAVLLTTPAGLPTASRFIKENPTRFVGFGDVKLDDPNILDEIDRFHQAGFRGLGEITSTLKNYDDRSYWPIYVAAGIQTFTSTCRDQRSLKRRMTTDSFNQFFGGAAS